MTKKLVPAVVLPGCYLLLTLLMACSSEAPREKSSFNSAWKFTITASSDDPASETIILNLKKIL